MAGANDPDSRRVLPKVPVDRATPGPAGPADSELLPPQAAVLALVEKLAALRRCLPQLRRGERTSLWAEPEVSVALHRAPTEHDDPAAVLVVLSRARNDKRIFVPAAAAARLPAGRYRDALSGEDLTVPSDAAAASLALSARALRSAVYLPQGHRCLPSSR